MNISSCPPFCLCFNSMFFWVFLIFFFLREKKKKFSQMYLDVCLQTALPIAVAPLLYRVCVCVCGWECVCACVYVLVNSLSQDFRFLFSAYFVCFHLPKCSETLFYSRVFYVQGKLLFKISISWFHFFTTPCKPPIGITKAKKT